MSTSIDTSITSSPVEPTVGTVLAPAKLGGAKLTAADFCAEEGGLADELPSEGTFPITKVGCGPQKPFFRGQEGKLWFSWLAVMGGRVEIT